MDRREKALTELKALIRRERARIDPKVLEKAQKAASQKSVAKKPEKSPNEGSVPYDTKAAKAAIALFLENHKDAPGFQKRLLEMLRKSTH